MAGRRPSYLLPQAMILTPQVLASRLLILLKPGCREWRGAIDADVATWLADLEHLACIAPAGEPAVEVRWISVKAAAIMLGLSERQTTAIAPKLGGRKVGKSWLLLEAEVAEEAEARSAAYSGRTEATSA